MSKYLLHNKPRWMAFLLFMTAYSISSTVVALVLSSILDIAAEGSIDRLIKTTVFAVLYVIGYIAITILYRKTKYTLLKSSNAALKADVFSAIMKKNISTYEKLSNAAYINELTTNAGMMEDLYFNNILDTASLLISFLAAVVVVVRMQPLLLLVMALMGGVTLLVTNLAGKGLAESTMEYSKSAEEYTVLLKEYFSGFRIIKTFRLFSLIEKIHQTKNAAVEEKKCRQRNKMLACACAGEFVGLFSTILVMAIAVFYATKGIVTVGAVLAVGHLMGRITTPITEMPDILMQFKSIKPIQMKFMELLSEHSHTEEGTPFKGLKDTITFKNVDFSYGDKPAIKQISLTLQKGRKYAIVGESGSGKTTLLLLLLGYYKDYSGSIQYDDQEIRDIDVASLYQKIGSISQETFLFEESLRNNLTLFDSCSEKDILQAVQKAELQDFVNQLPDGLDSKITENGRNLSGGERQRISLARVLLKDFPILYLDEFTASLDAANALRMERHLMTLKDKTLLTITHRLVPEILDQYDGILVLRKGRLEELGSYGELMQKKGYLYRLMQINAQNENL